MGTWSRFLLRFVVGGVVGGAVRVEPSSPSSVAVETGGQVRDFAGFPPSCLPVASFSMPLIVSRSCSRWKGFLRKARTPRARSLLSSSRRMGLRGDEQRFGQIVQSADLLAESREGHVLKMKVGENERRDYYCGPPPGPRAIRKPNDLMKPSANGESVPPCDARQDCCRPQRWWIPSCHLQFSSSADANKGLETVKENAETEPSVRCDGRSRKLADVFTILLESGCRAGRRNPSLSLKPEEPQITMTQSRIQVVFFDAADTLFHIHGSVADIYLQYAEKHGFKKTGESLGLDQGGLRAGLSGGATAGVCRHGTAGHQAIGALVVVRHRAQCVLSRRDVRRLRRVF